MKVLAAASEVFPLVKTGGLADVHGRAARRCWPNRGWRCARWCRATRRCWPLWARRRRVYALPALHGGAARVLAGRAAGLDLFVLDAPHLFDRPGNPVYRPRSQRLAGQCPALRRAWRAWRPISASAPCRAGCPAPCIATTGRPASPPPIISLRRRGPAAHRDDDPQPRLHRARCQWRYGGSWACRPKSLGDGRGGVLPVAIGFMKAGLFYADADHHRQPNLRRRDPDPGRSAVASTACCAPARSRGALHGILNGHGRGGLGSVDRHPPARSGTDAAIFATNRNARPRFAVRPGAGGGVGGAAWYGIVSRLTGQKGMDLVLDALPEPVCRRWHSSRCSGRAMPALETGFRDAAAAHPGQVAAVIGYDEAIVAPNDGRARTPSWCRAGSSRAD